MKRIIHLSDLHVGFRDLDRRLVRIIDNLLFSIHPASRHVVVVTGDLVDEAGGGQNYRRAARQLDRLRQAGFSLLVVPGNHDYGNGLISDKRYVRQFKQTFFGTTEIAYPKVDLIEGTAFIGLDSMAEELHWSDRVFAEGELGREQLGRLDQVLESRAVAAARHRVIYLHHHPFDPLPLHQLKDSPALGRLLRHHANVDALLYGHNHAAWKRHGMWGIPRCYDAGSATRKWSAPGAHRVIDLRLDPRFDWDGDFHGSG